MTTVLVSGWKQGFEKVAFTQLLRSVFGYSLSHAKRITDAVLEAQSIELQVADEEVQSLLPAMERLGAKCAVAVSAR